MKKIISVVVLLFFSGALLAAQESVKPKAKLVRSPFVGGDFLHVIEEAALDLKEYASGSADMVAIRVCSKEPLPVALSTATASPFIMLEYLEHYGFSRDRILFLRAEDCLNTNSAIAVTEFWAIPEGATLPPSVESIKSSQAQLKVVRTEDTIKSAQDYRAALQEVIAKLRAKPEAAGVVVGSFNENPSSVLKKNLCVAKSVLDQSRLPADRYFVRLTPSSGVRSGELSEPEPEYPDLFVVEVTRSRDSARK